jgi:starch synthase
MASKRIIYVSQEISPYLSVTPNAKLGREVPVKMQDRKYQVRTFMPDFGDINERRNQLHEVIRLSGVNIVINDNDHPLVIKVASMQPSRIQVYFIDNDDYFQKLDSDADSFGSNRADNDERAIFYARGTMETAKKLQWEPDFVHVSGWMSALVPIYLKKVFRSAADFKKTKVIYSVLPETEISALQEEFFAFLKEDGIKPAEIKKFKDLPLDQTLLHKMAIAYSDGVVFRGTEPNEELKAYCEENGKKWILLDTEAPHEDKLDEFYQSL